jgi:hypothetical protein
VLNFSQSAAEYQRLVASHSFMIIGLIFLQLLLFFLLRKIQNESATGSVSVNKVRTTLTIRIEAIDFDTQGCVLRVKGRNIEENQYVKV